MGVPATGGGVRSFLDDDLAVWEAWAAPGRRGKPEDGVIVFRSQADPGARPRVVRVPGGRTGAEARLRAASKEELHALFDESHPIA